MPCARSAGLLMTESQKAENLSFQVYNVNRMSARLLKDLRDIFNFDAMHSSSQFTSLRVARKPLTIFFFIFIISFITLDPFWVGEISYGVQYYACFYDEQ